jgi:hypothetical protein
MKILGTGARRRRISKKYTLFTGRASRSEFMAGGGNGTQLDYEELECWTRVGFERGTQSRKGER